MRPEDPRQIGPYRLVGQLGSGGMGRVFLGLSAGGRPVAVKVIRAELAADQEFRVRFGREVAAARRVSGLFTALVVDADVDGPVPWLATAYVGGPSLARAVSRHGPMAARPALALAAGLAEGLSAIHAAGVVHCDLKPSNVLLSPDGPRVIDFGISRAAGAASATGVGWVVGSPGFMSPEQAMGAEVGPSSDIFSLGAVLTFAATGGGPFGKGSSPELAYRLVYSPPDLALVPAELRPLVERCLTKDPGQRPTADEVLGSAAQPATGWLSDALGVFASSAALGVFAPPGAVLAGQSAALLTSERATPVPEPRHDSRVEAAALAPGLCQPSSPPPPRPAGRPRRWWRPLVTAGATACVLAASVAAGVTLSGAARHSPVAPLAPSTAARSSPAPARASAVPGTHPAAARSSSTTGPTPTSAVIPEIDTVTSPGSPADHPTATASATAPAPKSPSTSPSSSSSSSSSSPTASSSLAAPSSPAAAPSSPAASPSSPAASPSSPAASPSSPAPTPSPVPSTSPSATASSSRTRNLVPSTSPSTAEPQITGVDTYQQGMLVYFDVHYADPGNDAQGFGFMGVNGFRWVEESHPFAAPNHGIVRQHSIAYPLDLKCSTSGEHGAEIEAWIYDAAGLRSHPVLIRMGCQA